MQLDQRATELGEYFQKILERFKSVHCSSANGLLTSLNHQELRVVEILGREGSQIMRGLAEHLSLAVNSVTTVVDGMEQKELVVRQRSTADRRVIHVELTPAGQKIWRAVSDAKMELYRSMLSPLSAAEQEVFLDLFQKIAQMSSSPLTSERC